MGPNQQRSILWRPWPCRAGNWFKRSLGSRYSENPWFLDPQRLNRSSWRPTNHEGPEHACEESKARQDTLASLQPPACQKWSQTRILEATRQKSLRLERPYVQEWVPLSQVLDLKADPWERLSDAGWGATLPTWHEHRRRVWRLLLRHWRVGHPQGQDCHEDCTQWHLALDSSWWQMWSNQGSVPRLQRHCPLHQRRIDRNYDNYRQDSCPNQGSR